MQINLIHNYSNSNYINKNLDEHQYIYLNAKLKAPCDILNPQLIVNYETEIFSYNYVWIPDFNRYYYIVGKEVLKGNRLILYLKVDVLMSYRNEILNSYQLITRSESAGKTTYVVDSNFPVRQAGYNDVIKFSSSVFTSNAINETSFNYIINVAGGSKGASENNEN